MLDMSDALELVRIASAAARTRIIDVDVCSPDAVGYVIAEVVVSQVSVPPVPCSRVDGYAVRASAGPGRYTVVARLRPGGVRAPLSELPLGTVAWVTTGGAIPAGADSVVPVEGTSPLSAGDAPGAEEGVEIIDSVQPGDNVRPAASDVAAGQVLLRSGLSLSAGDVAALLSCGVRRVRAWRRPVVGILSSGDELADSAVATSGGSSAAVVDSNRPMLMHVLRGDAHAVLDLGIVRDVEADVAAAIAGAAAACDVIVTTGGVSMGDRDYVKPLLARLGRVIFGRLNMKPGKPTTLAVLERRGSPPADADAGVGEPAAAPGDVQLSDGPGSVLVFALPGNPVSAWVGAHVLVAPALRHMAGCSWAAARPPAVAVRVLDAGLRLDAERPEFHRATVWAEAGGGGGLVARSTGSQASSRILSLSEANALLWLPAATPGGPGVLASGPALAYLIGPVLAEGAVDTEVRTVGRGSSQSAYAGDCRCGRAVAATGTAAAPIAPAAHAHKTSSPERVPVTLCVLTVSDRCSRGEAVDTSGPAIVRHLTAGGAGTAAPRLDVTVVECACVPDDEGAIRDIVARWCGGSGAGASAVAESSGSRVGGTPASTGAPASLVITTGGTGFGLRDVTPEALRPLLRRPAPGLVHAMLEVGRAATPLAALSRYEAGVAGAATLVIEMPGSAKAVAECLSALDPLLPHALALLRGSD